MYRKKEWGKNIQLEKEDRLSHIPDDVREMTGYLELAIYEMQNLKNFTHLLWEGKRIQVDQVPPLPPSESDEAKRKAARYHSRKVSLARSTSNLRDAAERLRSGSSKDVLFFKEVRALRKVWTIQIFGGVSFAATLVVSHGNYAGPVASMVTLRRSVHGNVELRIAPESRPRLLFDENCSFPVLVEDKLVQGLSEVHHALVELQRSGKSADLFRLLVKSSASSNPSFACIKSDSNGVSADILLNGGETDLSLNLGQPKLCIASLEEFFAFQLLAELVKRTRNPEDDVFGPDPRCGKIASHMFSWLISACGHQEFKEIVSQQVLSICKKRRNCSFFWSGSDSEMVNSEMWIHSNLHLTRDGRARKKVTLTISHVGKIQINEEKRAYTLEEAMFKVQQILD